jgi:hypothetical protein
MEAKVKNRRKPIVHDQNKSKVGYKVPSQQCLDVVKFDAVEKDPAENYVK